jgi:hypothetical protein
MWSKWLLHLALSPLQSRALLEWLRVSRRPGSITVSAVGLVSGLRDVVEYIVVVAVQLPLGCVTRRG